MLQKENFLIYLFVVTTLLTSGSFAQRSSFGESCNDTLKCDKRAWLTCQNGTCDCMKPDVMMYETSLGKCASKAGERCKFIIEEFENNNAVFEIISCIKDSKCSADGFCVCDNKYYEDQNGTCTRSPSFLETCDSVVKCSTFEALYCTDGLCQCNETVSTFYSNGESESSDPQCVGLAGESCINSKCFSNAACSGENVCVCDDDYYQDDEKECVLKINSFGKCVKTEQCMNLNGTQLICLDGVCSCDPSFSRYGSAKKYGQSSEYSYSSGYFEGASFTQCLGLADSPCIDRLCVPNSYCKYNSYHGSENNGICFCSPGFTKSKSGSCGVSFNQNCNSAIGCIDGLMCGVNSRRCRCPFDQQEFNSSILTCMSKVDGPCDSLTSCIKNSECILFSDEPVEAGHCSCKSGFVKNPQGNCELAYGSPCRSTSDSDSISCDTVAGLTCLDFKCQCTQFAQYSEKYRKCLGLVGESCDVHSSEPECVENSICQRVNPRLQGVCTCPSESGLKETPQYTCELENENSKKSPIHDEE